MQIAIDVGAQATVVGAVDFTLEHVLTGPGPAAPLDRDLLYAALSGGLTTLLTSSGILTTDIYEVSEDDELGEPVADGKPARKRYTFKATVLAVDPVQCEASHTTARPEIEGEVSEKRGAFITRTR